MTEIAQLFESALRQNRASLLRKAAMNTVARMPASTTLRELLASDAGEAIRELTIKDLCEALAEAGLGPRPAATKGRRRAMDGGAGANAQSKSDDWSESREEQLFRRIMDAMADEPLTIGQLAKRVEIDTEELRGYLDWMKKAGKVTSSGRARATRYQAVRQ
jgi:predicted Rossmann fold nucleotide-binding protein DprA/Smf involved in DNA uptake